MHGDRQLTKNGSRPSADAEKRLAAARAVELVEDGMVLGLGTGSTAAHAVRLIGEKAAAGIRVKAVPTSEATRKLARECGIPMVGLHQVGLLDLTIDGADEIDPQMRLIKGGGGALLREKIVAAASRRVVIVADASKVVQQLGAFPLPVVVVPFGLPVVMRRVESLGARVTLRGGESTPFVTDDGNFIVDCAFRRIDAPEELHAALNAIPGVVDNGLFIGVADRVVVGRAGEVKTFRRPKDAAAG